MHPFPHLLLAQAPLEPPSCFGCCLDVEACFINIVTVIEIVSESILQCLSVLCDRVPVRAVEKYLSLEILYFVLYVLVARSFLSPIIAEKVNSVLARFWNDELTKKRIIKLARRQGQTDNRQPTTTSPTSTSEDNLYCKFSSVVRIHGKV